MKDKSKSPVPELLSVKDVQELLNVSRSFIYTRMERGEFPKPLKIGPRAVRWKRADVLAWIESQHEAKLKGGQE